MNQFSSGEINPWGAQSRTLTNRCTSFAFALTLGFLVTQNVGAVRAQALSGYAERTLGSGGYTTAQVNGIAPSGSFLIGTGSSTTGGTTTMTAGLAWTSTSTTPINLNEDGVTNSQATATDGTSIAGISTTGTTENVVIWSGTNFGTATTINVPFPTYSNINVSGISGSVITGYAVVNSTETAYTYNTATQAAVELNPTGSTGAETFGLTSTSVIGEATISGTQRAGIWTSDSAASFVNLGTVLGASYGASVADGINVGSTSTLIVGSATTSSGSHVAVAWSGSGSTYAATVLNSGTFASAYALGTNGGYIVGYGVDSSGVDHAIAWTADNSTTAPISLAANGIPSGGANSMATGIDRQGDIVGMSSGQGFELTSSAPEPVSLALVLIGGMGTLARGRRIVGRRAGISTVRESAGA